MQYDDPVLIENYQTEKIKTFVDDADVKSEEGWLKR
jgi:hypothetical protein